MRSSAMRAHGVCLIVLLALASAAHGDDGDEKARRQELSAQRH